MRKHEHTRVLIVVKTALYAKAKTTRKKLEIVIYEYGKSSEYTNTDYCGVERDCNYFCLRNARFVLEIRLRLPRSTCPAT